MTDPEKMLRKGPDLFLLTILDTFPVTEEDLLENPCYLG